MGVEHGSPTPRVTGNTPNLKSYFDKSASTVQSYAGRFEHEYGRPAVKTSKAFFDERPISAIFIAIFAALSFLPVLSFLAISLLVIASFTTLALICAVLASTMVILACLMILIFTLIAILFASVLMTMLVISCYLFIRFATLVHRDGSSGIWSWAGETKQHISDRLSRNTTRDLGGYSPASTIESVVMVPKSGSPNISERVFKDDDTKVQG